MNPSTYGNITPGTRVMVEDTTLGTVERLEARDAAGGQPDHMIVRSQDGQQHYNIPLMLVSGIDQQTFGSAVRLNAGMEQLRHYQVEQAGGMTPPAMPTAVEDDGTLRIPLAAEELVAQKQPIVLGKVRVHKGVETVQQNLTVPVYHEEAIVEHIPVDQYDPNAPSNPGDLIIPVTEEQIVVEKRSVVKEYIRIRKNVVTQEQHVSDTVRREFVELTEQRQSAGDLTLLHYGDANAVPASTSGAASGTAAATTTQS